MTPGQAPAESYLLMIALASGAVVLALEVVWTRFAAFFLGNRGYAFATLMFAVLTLLALGAGWSARLYRTTSRGNLYSRFATLLVLVIAGRHAVGGGGLVVDRTPGCIRGESAGWKRTGFALPLSRDFHPSGCALAVTRYIVSTRPRVLETCRWRHRRHQRSLLRHQRGWNRRGFAGCRIPWYRTSGVLRNDQSAGGNTAGP